MGFLSNLNLNVGTSSSSNSNSKTYAVISKFASATKVPVYNGPIINIPFNAIKVISANK